MNVFKPEPFKSDNDGLSELLNQLFSNNKMKQTSTIENNNVQNEKNESKNDDTSIDQINPNTTNSDDSDESNTNNLEKIVIRVHYKVTLMMYSHLRSQRMMI